MRAFPGALTSCTLAFAMALGLSACNMHDIDSASDHNPDLEHSEKPRNDTAGQGSGGEMVTSFTPGSDTYRDMTVDNVLHAAGLGDVHFSLFVPDSYDGSHTVPLFITLPGYQGLYFQGAGSNIRTEDFAFTAREHEADMIVAAPQLDDWHQTSADKTIALTEYLLSTYAIDPDRIYLEGYSGGGETLSLVMGTKPELYRAALLCASQWDGDLRTLSDARVPVRLSVGASDEYYGSGPARQAAEELRSIYESSGLSRDETDRLVVLDVKPSSYFTTQGATNQHGDGAQLMADDDEIMGWLFAQ